MANCENSSSFAFAKTYDRTRTAPPGGFLFQEPEYVSDILAWVSFVLQIYGFSFPSLGSKTSRGKLRVESEWNLGFWRRKTVREERYDITR